jgi:hypothetical protein
MSIARLAYQLLVSATIEGAGDSRGQVMSAILALEAAPIDRTSRLAAAANETDDVVELALVLPRWQMDELASAARHRGLTAGQAIRRMIRAFCADDERADG